MICESSGSCVEDESRLPNRALPGVPIFVSVLLVISTITVSIRLLVRCRLKPNAGWSDVLQVTGYVQLCAVGWVIATLIQIKYGAHGRHAKTQTLKEEIAWDKSNLAENLFLTSSLFTSRFSLCILLRGVIFHKQRLIHAVYTAMALDTIFFVATMVTYSIASVPISKLWYPKTPGFLLPGEVLVKFIQAFGAVNCIVDFLCAGVAFFLVYCIPLTKEVKAGVSLLVLGGFVTASCSIGRAAGIRPNDPDSPCKFESLLEG